MVLAAILKARHTRVARRKATSMREQTFTPVKHRLRDNVRAMRESEIEAPALNDNGRPILTSMWIPTNAQVQEYNQTPFHAAAIAMLNRAIPLPNGDGSHNISGMVQSAKISGTL